MNKNLIPPINKLIEVLTATFDSNAKARILSAYIQQFGPIPNEYRVEIENALKT